MSAIVGISLAAYADSAGLDPDGEGTVTTGSISISDGSIADWGVTLPGTNNDYTGSVWNDGSVQGGWVFEDSVNESLSNYVGPLYGGQDFDAEALYTGFDVTSNTLYVALVTGFNLGGENGGGAFGSPFSAGDIFIDFGTAIQQNGRKDDPTTVGNDQNADVPSTPGNSVAYNNSGHTSWDLAFLVDQSATLTNGTTGDINASAVTGFGIDYSPTPDGAGQNSGPLFALGGSGVGTAGFRYTQGIIGTENRNLYEFSYTLTNSALHNSWRNSMLESGSGSFGWTVHWTMSCGNDYLDAAAYLDDTTNFTPLVPVPAAAPLGMLGMGLIALVRRVRRRTEC
ncbi:MAG: VPLPA-CTERM sorting domain-containing protein [Candidatus Hydrogenedentes bacterium]|nr:VPLPA-CTERM sorting domain-containing protein [Candidatus Hydrogenedentota bacterium]